SFQAEDGIRDRNVTGVQTCALPISINQLAISILKPKEGTLYDGTMGLGSGLLEAARQTDKNKLDFYGQEIKGNVWAITKIRFFRSEERRVGKESRCMWETWHLRIEV